MPYADCCAVDFPQDPETAARFVNFQTFIARVYERGLLQGQTLPIFFIVRVFDAKRSDTQAARDAYAKAALQYLLIGGDAIYYEITEEEDRKPYNKWQHWREQVSAIATGNSEDKTCTFSQDVVEMAGRAQVAMEAIERLKIG